MTTLADAVSQKSLTKNFQHSRYGNKENRTITGDYMLSLICIPNMTPLACMVVNKSLTKNFRGWTEGLTDKAGV